MKNLKAVEIIIDHQINRLQLITGMDEMEVLEILPFIEQQVCDELHIELETFIDWQASLALLELETV